MNSLTLLSIKELIHGWKHIDRVICVKHPNQIKLKFLHFVILYISKKMSVRERGWAKNVEVNVWRERKPTRCNNQIFIINFCLIMFRASLCPSSGEQRPCYCISYNAAPHNRYQPHPAEPEQYNICSNTVFVLLKMGIMMPETCWDRSW